MSGFNGGFIGGNVLPTASQKQPGIWSLQEAYRGRVSLTWPSIAVVAAGTGGDDVYNITIGGQQYAIHLFYSTGAASLVLTSAKTVEYLVVGGGGSGGGST
jgi:hypothetical protein